MVPPRLLVFSDEERFPQCSSQLVAVCQEARPGTVAVILRDRTQTGRERLALGRRFCTEAQQAGQLFLVAERFDLACLLDADGVHLPAHGLAPTQAPPSFSGVLSRAGHGAEALSLDELQRLDLLVISPVCAPRKGRDPLTIQGFNQRANVLRSICPTLALYALGGITGDNAPNCLQGGADGVAVIGAAMNLSDRTHLLQALQIRRE